MKKSLALAVVLALGSTLAARALAGEAATGGASKTISGELIDSACYFDSGKSGPGHKKCAEICVKGGAPMGVLGADGTVFILVADHSNEKPYEALKDMVAAQVEVTGRDVSKGGVNVLVVESAKKK